jgi:hypothetical protein
MRSTAAGSAIMFDDRRASRETQQASLSLHRLDEEAWLLDRCGQRLFHLNPTAALIWSAHLSGLGHAEIAGLLSRHQRIAVDVAAAYVGETLRPRPSDADEAAEGGAADGGEAVVVMPEASHFETYRVLDTAIRLGFVGRALFARIGPNLCALHVDDVAGVPREWRLGASGAGYALAENGRMIDRCARVDRVAPMLKLRLVYAALEASRDACALHAAALGAGGRCLLLPGRSGAGKSTLAAGLAHAGFEFLGDDTTVVTNGVPAIRPLPLPIALKTGSWMMLSDRIPGLLDLPIHWRPDGKAVRYISPPAAAMPGTAALPVGWIVFPARARGRAPALERLGAGVALKRLMAGLAPLGAGLTPATLERLIAWIEQVPCFELRYGALDDAIVLLRELCR